MITIGLTFYRALRSLPACVQKWHRSTFISFTFLLFWSNFQFWERLWSFWMFLDGEIRTKGTLFRLFVYIFMFFMTKSTQKHTKSTLTSKIRLSFYDDICLDSNLIWFLRLFLRGKSFIWRLICRKTLTDRRFVKGKRNVTKLIFSPVFFSLRY